jgi:hypothetical protein
MIIALPPEYNEFQTKSPNTSTSIYTRHNFATDIPNRTPSRTTLNPALDPLDPNP